MWYQIIICSDSGVWLKHLCRNKSLDIFDLPIWFTYRRKWESSDIRLQCSWSFGKTKFTARERNTNQDANRIKENEKGKKNLNLII